MSDKKTVRLKAMDLLARREHSVVELLEKLGQRFPDQAALMEEVVAGLRAEGLQSDRRFAESYARLRLDRGPAADRSCVSGVLMTNSPGAVVGGLVGGGPGGLQQEVWRGGGGGLSGPGQTHAVFAAAGV